MTERWREVVAEMIETYLEDLRKAFAGSDPALVQDALYDAEEYLRAEMADAGENPEARFAEVVEAYGSPDEVAAAYRDAEITVARALRPAPAPKTGNPFSRFFGAVIDPRAYAALFYMLLSFVTGITYLVLVSVMLPLGLGLLPVGVGILVLLLFFAMVRAISLVEGRLIEALLGVRMPRRPRSGVAKGDVFMRMKGWFTDGRTWTSILYMVLQSVLGTVYFSLIVTMLSASLGLIAWPFVQSITEVPLIQVGNYGYILQPWAYPLVVAAGAFGIVLMLNVCRMLGTAHAWYAKAMLVGHFTDTVDQAA